MTLEELQNENIRLKEEKELLETKYNSLKEIEEQNNTTISKLENDITTLKEHNMRLYLKVTQPVDFNNNNTLPSEANTQEQQGEPKVNINDILKELRG